VPKEAPVASAPAVLARPEPVSDIPFAVGVRDQRQSASRQRVLALLITEIQQLEALLKSTDARSPNRPALLRRLAEDYVELENAAFREKVQAEAKRDELKAADPEGAAREQARADARRTTMVAARKRVIEYYTLLAAEYSGQPSATFPSNPPTAYAGLDEVFYYLAYEYEQAADMANARRVYLDLIQKTPQSKYVPPAYLSFGELFYVEAKADPSKWDLARQAYLKVVSSPPQENKVYAYAWYKLALVYLNQGDRPHAQEGFQRAADAASEFPELPQARRIGAAARAELARLQSATPPPPSP
jgi:TolA-binding protein